MTHAVHGMGSSEQDTAVDSGGRSDAHAARATLGGSPADSNGLSCHPVRVDLLAAQGGLRGASYDLVRAAIADPEFRPELLRWCKHWGPGAEEIADEAIAVLCGPGAAASYRPELGTVMVFAFGIARRVRAAQARRAARRVPPAKFTDRTKAEEPGAEDIVAGRDSYVAVRRALARLSLYERELILRRFELDGRVRVEAMSSTERADLSRALAELRRMLAAER